MNEKKNHKAENIVVFGASRGIGMQIASNLLKKKHNILISSGNKLNLSKAFKKLQEQSSYKNNLQSILLDFEDHNSISKNLSPILKLNQMFNVLIFSSAVLGPSGCFSDVDIIDWKKTFNVNVFGPATVIQFFLKNNLLEKNSKIIILSGGISGPDPFFNSFSASKHALNGFIYSLSHELANQKIWCNSILPGSYHTKMNEIRIERGPKNIGSENYKIALSRKTENHIIKYNKLNKLIEFFCSSKANGIFGKLISAQYDNWEDNIDNLKNKNNELYQIIRKKD